NWEEWTRPRGAALPSASFLRPKLITRSPWIIFRGGRNAANLVNYTVGDARFGRTLWRLDPWDTINIFEIYPKIRMAFQVSTVPFRDAPVEGFDTIHGKPDMSHVFSM
ncbi:MAG: hypothetical protein LBL05_01895, partial [Synergistaceae bacterium]|nr:hypothetical protein [Synergistaceae bacterium]